MGRNINRRMSGHLLRGGVWHIDKVIHGTRICESTGTSDLEDAEALLMRRLRAARATRLFGAPAATQNPPPVATRKSPT